MAVPKLSSLLQEPVFSHFRELAKNAPSGEVSGLEGSALASFVAHLHHHGQKNLLLLFPTQKEAEIAQEDLYQWNEEAPVLYFPPLSLDPYTWRKPFGQITEQRLQCLSHLVSGKPAIVITTFAAFFKKLMAPSFLQRENIQLQQDQEISLEDLRASLVHLGFSEEAMVEDMGQFSIRGGIVDIYPYVASNPFRLELWGDTVESIREFDIFSQRSIRELSFVDVLPMEECCLSRREIEDGLLSLSDSLDEDQMESEIHRLLEENDRVGIPWQLPFYTETTFSLCDYFSEPPTVVLQEPAKIWLALEKHLTQAQEAYAVARDNRFLVADPEKLYFSRREVESLFNKQKLLRSHAQPVEGPGFTAFHVQEQVAGGGNLGAMEDVFKELAEKHYRIYLLSPNEGQAERLKKLTAELPIEGIVVGQLSKGFISHTDEAALFTDHQIFNRFSRRLMPKKFRGGVSIPNFEALNKLDIVVHEDYGIGQYLGIKRIQVENHYVDCILLQYKDNSKLTIPVSDLKKLQKYAAKEDTSPSLSKLGGKAWEQLKKRTKKSILKLAKDLIELYARRSQVRGFSFPPDGHLQKEFEEAFLYTPTPDQITAAEAVKKDMEKSDPMDRLICGDVGFGKTEVAMRAAFKAVLSKKQVAVLAPTTVLVSQHHASFQDRFGNWPVNVEYLNRFRSSQDEARIKKEVAEGKVDILIGTHKILSKHLHFKDLGLIIVDEEQKFGVQQKEKLKKTREHVDVISMSATPIPRSLHMSLVGARDFSLIQTPPLNRIPIDTRVIRYEEEKIREFLRKELERGGQTFFVHNRIQNIREATLAVEKLVPDARVGMAHGQMPEHDLEQIMFAFINREYDVLVSTAIIESGIDLPNVNTIIINNAHQFGLSQLFQLRGRVGRSSTQAYCLLIAPPDPKFTDEAKKRLYALEKFTELGSGYQLAMRDLEIRGAGNILGVEQSGHIAAVGFDTYCKLLKEAVRELQGKDPEPQFDSKVEFPENAYLPEEYIEDGLQRIALYQKISRCQQLEEVDALEAELQDRYGPLPAPSKALLQVVRAQVLAHPLGFQRVSLEEAKLELEYAAAFEPGPEKLSKLLNRFKRPFKCLNETPLKIVVHLSTAMAPDSVEEALEELKRLGGYLD